jgi:outer membrane protein assembly factor BamB
MRSSRASVVSVLSLSLGLVATALAIPTSSSAAAPLAMRVVAAQSGSTVAALPPLAPGDWTGFRNRPAGSGANSTETTINAGTVAGLHLWRSITSQTTGGGITGVTGHGLLYLQRQGGGVAAYDQATGALRWSTTEGSGLLTVGDTAVYTVSGGGIGAGNSVVANDPGTGAQLWRKSLTGVVYAAPPTLAGSRLLVPWINGAAPKWRSVLTAFDAATGAKLWQTKLPGQKFPGSVSAGATTGALTLSDGRVQTLNLATGALRWSFSTGASADSALGQIRPVIHDDRLYVGLLAPKNKGVVKAFDLSSGATLWTRSFSLPLQASLAEDHGVVYVSLDAGSLSGLDDLYALDSTTGAKLWSTRTGAVGSPTLAGGVVFQPTFFTGTGFRMINAATGVLLSTYPMDDELLGEPVVSHGQVVLLTGAGEVLVLAP